MRTQKKISLTVLSILVFIVVGILAPLDAFSQTEVIWKEDFNGYANGTYQATKDGVTWEGVQLVFYDRIRVVDGEIQAYVLGRGSQNWKTNEIDISAYSNVSVSVSTDAWDGNDKGNYIEFQYRVDGGYFQTIDSYSGGFSGVQVAKVENLNGSDLELRVIVYAKRNWGVAVYYFDDVVVSGTKKEPEEPLELALTKEDIHCIGSNDGTITAEASGGTPPYQYALGGYGYYQSSGSFENLAARTYTVWVKDNSGIEVSEQITIEEQVSTGEQEISGTNNWIGHVYKRLDSNPDPPTEGNAFSKYAGTITATESFDRDFGSSCFDVSSEAQTTGVYPEYFAIRYRMTSSKEGIYLADIGSDDGSRLTVDNDLIYDRWIERGYREDQQVLFALSGGSKLVLDYYESGGQNRLSFSNLKEIANELSTPSSVFACDATAIPELLGNNAYTESPISGNGNFVVSYQWEQALAENGPWDEISGAIEKDYQPELKEAGTYYFRRVLTVAKNNPGISTPVEAKSYSGAIQIIVSEIKIEGTVTNAGCSGDPDGAIDVTVSGGTAPYSYSWTKDGSLVSNDLSLGSISSGEYKFTVTDANTCSSMETFIVAQASDAEVPFVVCPVSERSYECVNDLPVIGSISDFQNAGGQVSDNCSSTANLQIESKDVVDPGEMCKVIRTYTVTDEAGNKGTCTQEFTITDTEAPTISCEPIELAPDADNCSARHSIIPQITENCNLVDNGIEVTLTPTINHSFNSETLELTADFPLGITTIEWTVTDECGHTATCEQQVIVEFPMTSITYDGQKTQADNGPGMNPVQTSVHTYQVDGGINQSGYTYQWSFYQDANNNGALDAGEDVNPAEYSITGANSAGVSLTYAGTNDVVRAGSYSLAVTKTRSGTSCKKTAVLPIYVQENTFDLRLEPHGNDCQSGETDTPTKVVWEITFGGNGEAPYQLGYAINLNDGTGAVTTCSGTIEGISLAATAADLSHISGCLNTGITPFVSLEKKSGSSTLRLEYTVSSRTAQDFSIGITVDGSDVFSVSEIEATNNSEDLELWGVPNISDILTD